MKECLSFESVTGSSSPDAASRWSSGSGHSRSGATSKDRRRGGDRPQSKLESGVADALDVADIVGSLQRAGAELVLSAGWSLIRPDVPCTSTRRCRSEPTDGPTRHKSPSSYLWRAAQIDRKPFRQTTDHRGCRRAWPSCRPLPQPGRYIRSAPRTPRFQDRLYPQALSRRAAWRRGPVSPLRGFHTNPLVACLYDVRLHRGSR